MFNRDSCRYLLSCLAFSEIHLSWLSKLSYHPLMFQQQDDSFKMVLPHFWHLKSVNWDHLRGIWKWYSVMWLMQNYYLNTAMRPGQIFFLNELSALKLPSHIHISTSISPLPLRFPHLCCLWLLRCLCRLSITLDYNGEKGKSWCKYSVRINDTSCLPCWQEGKKRKQKYSANQNTLSLT